MTAGPEEFAELRSRVGRPEVGLAEVPNRAETAETLARLADTDTSDIKASHGAILRSLDALREAQVDQGQVLAEHGQQLAELRGDVSEIRTGLGVVRDGVATIISLVGGNGPAG